MVNRRAEVLDALEYNRRGRTILKALQTLQKPSSSNNEAPDIIYAFPPRHSQFRVQAQWYGVCISLWDHWTDDRACPMQLFATPERLMRAMGLTRAK